MAIPVRRTSILLDFGAPEPAAAFAAAFRNAGIPGRVRVSGALRDKVKFERGGRIELGELERILEEKGLAEALGGVEAVRLSYLR